MASDPRLAPDVCGPSPHDPPRTTPGPLPPMRSRRRATRRSGTPGTTGLPVAAAGSPPSPVPGTPHSGPRAADASPGPTLSAIHRAVDGSQADHATGSRPTQLPLSGPDAQSAAPVRRGGSPRAGALRDSAFGALVLAHPAAFAVLACYALAAMVVPTLTAAPVSDDWVYSRSVEILLREGDLRVLDLSVITLLFQVAWGGFFSLVFGLSFGAMRLSTIVLTALSGVAFYAMLGQLAVPRPRAALGTAVYLFNPLAFVLGFSFMTDPHFAAMLVITLALTVRGLRPDAPSRQATVLGSVAAAGAILVRQQGVLIPFAVVLYLVAARRLRPDRAGVRLFLDIVAIPAVTTVLYYAWLFFIHGVPEQQDAFLDQVLGAGLGGSWQLVRLMTVIEMVYVGFIILPLVLGTLVGALHLVRRPVTRRPPARSRRPVVHRRSADPGRRSRAAQPGITRHLRLTRTGIPGVLFLGGWVVVLVAGLVWFAGGPASFGPLRMPYVSQFVGLHGLGPSDLWGGRPWLTENVVRTQDLLTYASALGSLVFAVTIARRMGDPGSPDRAGAALVAAVGLWQVVGVLPPSFHFRTWIISVDRYLLPLLPVAIALFLWSLRGVRFSTPVAWVAIAAVGMYSVVATRDFLVFQDATWEFAAYAHEEIGVPLTRLDAGSSWDGYHLYEYSVANAIPHQSPGGPWWTHLFATATDSSYVVTSQITTPPGYQVIAWTEYSSWLHDRPVYLFLMQRTEIAPPPV